MQPAVFKLPASRLALIALVAALGACREAPPPAATVSARSNDTTVLGGYGDGGGSKPATVTDARGVAIPPPPLPRETQAQMVRSGPESAVAVWVQGGDVLAAQFTRAGGWAPAQVLETMHGEATGARIASNGRGQAMAVWQHTVGAIQSLRFSRFETGTGWSVPDVMPGALPRPVGTGGPIQLSMDSAGNALARWPSGFDARDVQAAHFVAGKGWSHAESERLAASSLPRNP